ncbi:hypothetical protein F6X40_40720 [Paraburkholderia sp. UCT31]|uniref:hypothetical protein n=1 Tax=Paraburkholderia sp. UCT31 TaxID=2615209 RepID=UPI001654FE71|nr:hypothetical protein [Paraburkholderia sp. UCT31]MBC8742799.1 hypothetical protein [Paraburkholderia sp. UCT31]
MSTPQVEAAEPERKATLHTTVLEEKRRAETGLNSGLISRKDALYMAYYVGPRHVGVSTFASLRLGKETPFYEVAIRGKVYRALAQPVPGQSPRTYHRDVAYQLSRCWAPGLRSDGWLLEPPEAVPNTPRALVQELQTVLDLNLEDILDNAFSILNYRRHHGAQYPDTLEPAGYRLRELFLMSVNDEGNLVTLYETPRGVNVELWSLFLRVLDRENRPTLADYVNSSMAVKEFGEAGVAAMREALSLRDGHSRASGRMGFTRFLDAFPVPDHTTIERIVGGRRR